MSKIRQSAQINDMKILNTVKWKQFWKVKFLGLLVYFDSITLKYKYLNNFDMRKFCTPAYVGGPSTYTFTCQGTIAYVLWCTYTQMHEAG